MRNPACQAKALQTGLGEHNRVESPVGESLQSRIDVASDVVDLEVGAAVQQLCAAAEAARPDHRPRTELFQRTRLSADERIAHRVPLGDGGQAQSFNRLGGQILETVNGQIDPAVEDARWISLVNTPWVPIVPMGPR